MSTYFQPNIVYGKELIEGMLLQYVTTSLVLKIDRIDKILPVDDNCRFITLGDRLGTHIRIFNDDLVTVATKCERFNDDH
jgi:hypothetical protein